MAFNLGEMLANPNFQQALGNAGAAIAGPGSFAAAINPAEAIRQAQVQKAGEDMLAKILGGATSPETVLDQPAADTSGIPPLTFSGQMPQPTPIGQAGPDSVTTKQTADGTVTTIAAPSTRNLDTFGTTVPLEAQPKQATPAAGAQSTVPFFQALFNQ